MNDMTEGNYTEEELNAMCDAAADKEKCREYNLREAEYYNKRAELDMQTRTVTVEEDGDDLILAIPDDILESMGWKENDVLEWETSEEGVILKKLEQ